MLLTLASDGSNVNKIVILAVGSHVVGVYFNGMEQSPIMISVYDATYFVAVDGVATGEPISIADDLVMDDVYEVQSNSPVTQLSLTPRSGGNTLVCADRPGAIIHLDCCLQLMSPHGATIEAVIMVAVADGMIDAIYVYPLAPLHEQIGYRLVGVDRYSATRQFAQAGCGSFAGGTRVTMADGRMCPVDTLEPGDLVLTRDHGPQPLRWIGKTTLRASGSFSPVMIKDGVLNNAADLVVRADHRLFVYQRSDQIGAGRPEVLIRARHLINGDTVILQEGGFIDYFQLVFDAHYIIFAEGISAESQRIDAHSRPLLPSDILISDHPHTRFLDYEVDTNLIGSGQAAQLLRKATTR